MTDQATKNTFNSSAEIDKSYFHDIDTKTEIEAKNCEKIIFVGGNIVVKNNNAACSHANNGYKHSPCNSTKKHSFHKGKTNLMPTFANGDFWINQSQGC